MSQSDVQVEYLVVGAGVSGLSFANAILAEASKAKSKAPSVLVLEKDGEPGGYCKTIHQDGFVWDYSGHFFHFRKPEIETWLRERMPNEEFRHVAKQSMIRLGQMDIDFPFQKNIHQLPHDDFVDCLYHLYFSNHGDDEGDMDSRPKSFKDMLYRSFGQGIAERFLIPYNEKLYACDLDTLDVDAMGRFFPKADIASILRNMKSPDNSSYNSTFTYPKGGAISFIHALMADLPNEMIALGEELKDVDLTAKVATTSKRKIAFSHLVSSAPLPVLAKAAHVDVTPDTLSSNKVLVFNLGFDAKGREDLHWMYYPEKECSFYRVGYYDNIMGTERMSLYVEIGKASGDAVYTDAELKVVLEDLKRFGVVTDQNMISWHSVVLDPAYVHITKASIAEHARLTGIFSKSNVHSVGRYGGWTYCSIEDNIIETRALAKTLVAAA